MNHNPQASKINFAIDPNQHEIWGSGSGGYITESGKYLLAVTNAVYEPTTQNANNWKLSLTLRFLAGKFKDKEIGTSLNIAHSQETTREAAMKQLASYCTAMGISQAWDDAAIMYNKPFQAYIEATQEASQSDPNKKYWRNELKNWFYPNGEPIQQGVFASGALLTVVYNGDAAPVVPNGAPSTIAPPVTAPQTGNPAAGAGGYGNGAPAHLQGQQQQVTTNHAGAYGNQPQDNQHQQQQQHGTTPPAFNQGAPAGTPNGNSPAFAGGGTTGTPPQGQGFGAPPQFGQNR